MIVIPYDDPDATITPESELANSVGRDWLKNFMLSFGPAIRRERATSQVATALFIDALAGAAALTIAGRHDSEDEVMKAIVATLRNAIKRDLRHLRG